MGRLATRRYVEIGRVVRFNFGKHTGKVAAIVSLGDHNRVIVQGPASDIPRHEIRLRNVTLTGIVIPRSQTTPDTFAEGFKAALEQWNNSPTAKHIAAAAAKTTATDFDRFKKLVQISHIRKKWLPVYAKKRAAIVKDTQIGTDLRRRFA
eukprot:TRINITY_DN962_c0_g1_i1.p2 TRINITY_DN962_c0_g1~~TRINITY_DN962_c0_g1_i1.p2  ORF type:complete len:150 (-),score=28.37 TRINITY_DN962_c0_g1_i1:522-971(-)